MTAGVHDKRVRSQQRFDLFEQQEPFLAARNQARRGRVEDQGYAFNLRRQRRDTCIVSGALGARQCSARRFRPQAPHRDPRNHQLVGGPQRGRQKRGVEIGENTLRLF
jgi:hypothetical protein